MMKKKKKSENKNISLIIKMKLLNIYYSIYYIIHKFCYENESKYNCSHDIKSETYIYILYLF